MNIKTYSHARQNLADLMDEVHETRAPVVITRQGSKPVVMLSLDDYESMEETLHLIRSPKNAAHLLESIDQAKSGKLLRHDPTKRPAKRK